MIVVDRIVVKFSFSRKRDSCYPVVVDEGIDGLAGSSCFQGDQFHKLSSPFSSPLPVSILNNILTRGMTVARENNIGNKERERTLLNFLPSKCFSKNRLNLSFLFFYFSDRFIYRVFIFIKILHDRIEISCNEI